MSFGSSRTSIRATRYSPRRFYCAVRRRKKLLSETAVFIFLAFAAILLATDKRYTRAVTDGIALWAANILPALFPYIFITYILSALDLTGKAAQALSPLSERVFKINGNGFYAFLLSLACGYPIGAKTVSELKLAGKLGDAESVRASAICSSSSPAFLIGSVGNIAFNSPLFGVLLYLSHFLSVLTVGIVFSIYKRKEKPIKCKPTLRAANPDILFDGVYSSVISVLTIGGIITVFYLFTEILSGIGVISAIAAPFSAATGSDILGHALANGLFECTKGVKIAAASGVTFMSLPVCGALAGFGGISVIAQSFAFLKKARIKIAPFILSRITAAISGFAFGLIFAFLL